MSHPLPKISVRTDGVTCRAEFDDPEWTCQDCHGRGGSMERDEEGYEVFVACRCKSALRRLDLFNAAGIGKRFASATLGSYTRHNNLQGRALQKAEEFSMLYPKVENGLLFWGPVGTGKTHLAVAIFRELTLRKGVSCRFVDYGNLLQDLRRAFSGGGGDAPYHASVACLFQINYGARL